MPSKYELYSIDLNKNRNSLWFQYISDVDLNNNKIFSSSDQAFGRTAKLILINNHVQVGRVFKIKKR